MMISIPKLVAISSIWQELPSEQQDAIVRLLSDLAVKYVTQSTSIPEASHDTRQHTFQNPS